LIYYQHIKSFIKDKQLNTYLLAYFSAVGKSVVSFYRLQSLLPKTNKLLRLSVI